MNNKMRWQPFVTVAAIIENDNKFLLVEENINDQIFFNQPAGHWEYGESLQEAITREVLEETAWHFIATDLVRIYQWSPTSEEDKTFLRFTFCGNVERFEENLPLDEKIIRTHWLSYEEIKALNAQHRSPQVMRCIDEYLEGKHYPLDIISVV